MRTGGEVAIWRLLLQGVVGVMLAGAGVALAYYDANERTLGYMAVPEAPGPRPAVVLIHEWNGRWPPPASGRHRLVLRWRRGSAGTAAGCQYCSAGQIGLDGADDDRTLHFTRTKPYSSRPQRR